MASNLPIYSSYSLYYNTPINSQGELGIWVPRPIPSSINDKIITISPVYNQRPDLLAHDLYNDSRLWWVFSQRNPNSLAADPLGNFIAGLQIYIPNPSILKTLLGI